MKEKWIDHKKKEIYFLEWLSKESGFSENQILENMRPENQKWNDKIREYRSIEEFQKNNFYDWIIKLFLWKNSFLNKNEFFWSNICYNWSSLLDYYLSENYKIKFSKYSINDWKIQKINKFIVKEKKLKI